jgi:hypothetical protein
MLEGPAMEDDTKQGQVAGTAAFALSLYKYKMLVEMVFRAFRNTWSWVKPITEEVQISLSTPLLSVWT